MTQYQIEKHLGITLQEANWLNSNKDNATRNSVVSLLATQCHSYDPAGFAMLEEAVTDMRKHIASML